MSAASRPTATAPCELTPEALARGVWDGKVLPYVPLSPPPADVPFHDEAELDLDPVTYQVLRWRLWNVNLEHDDTIRRVCGTSIICHALDYNTSLLTEVGQTVLGGPSLQRFVGQGDLSVRYTLETRRHSPGIGPGDVFVLNDPYIATSHQLDVATYRPVFFEDKLFCWVFNAAHSADVGGMQPGSFCPEAKDIYDEPLPWPPTRLVHGGELCQDVYDLFLRQSRSPSAMALNLRSQIAGLETAERRVRSLLEEYGAAVVKGVMRRMLTETAQAVARRLAEIPDGEWSETYLVGGITDGEVRRLRTTVRKTGEILTFSNEGTDPQLATGNGTYCSWRSAAMSCVGTMLAWDQMYCPGGVLQQLRFDPHPGTFTVASFPAGVTTVVGTNMAIALAGQAVSKMLLAGPPYLQERALASGGLTSAGYCSAFGYDASGELQLVPLVDSVIGALGASPGLDGVDTGGSWEWPQTSAADVEEAEEIAPVLYLYRREQTDSGGPGRWRGGNGVEIALAGQGVESLFFMAGGNDPAANSAPGLAGGRSAHCGEWAAMPDAGVRAMFARGVVPGDRPQLQDALGAVPRVPVNRIIPLGGDGVAVGQHAAGAGVGDPLTRDPEAVAGDVRAGAVSIPAARDDYGVVITGTGLSAELDAAATETERTARRAARLADAAPPAAPASAPEGGWSARRTIGPGLLAARDGAGWQWACGACEAPLGALAGDVRHGCASRRSAPEVLDARRYLAPAAFLTDAVEVREWLCPACGQQIVSEFTRAGDEPEPDVRIDADALDAELAAAGR